MSNEVVIREQEASSVVAPKPQEALAKVVESVRRDSQLSPQAFLAESVVPHGGE